MECQMNCTNDAIFAIDYAGDNVPVCAAHSEGHIVYVLEWAN